MRVLAAAALALLLAACASPQYEQPGATRADVVARLGAPTLRMPLADGGEQLLYSGQPMGLTVYLLSFDASGRLVRKEQTLTQEQLQAIPTDGRWTADDVRRRFGPPARIDQVASFDGDVWNYRFQGDFGSPRLAHVHIDRAGVVRRVMFTDEFLRDRMRFR
ncbi:MAG: hypothetical protein QM740_05720 [Acidovorax sp.]